MSRCEKLSQVLWNCQYYIAWTPKYHYLVLTGKYKRLVEETIRLQINWLGCGRVELHVKDDHVHLLVNVPPKVSISVLMGALKVKTAVQMFNRYAKLKEKTYWGNHFWA